MEKPKEKNVHSTVSAHLNEKILSVQKNFSIWLNWKCRHLSMRAMLTLLIAFLAICSSYFLSLIISAVD
ncbi:hypothetical protein ACTJKC_15325 [Pedobacter sp. 22226]|uniref:hypothetical protein n=1 Tax=Pedobacter sp. 22226 TaxID=3453894 RepID=UPI003F867356